MQGVYGKPSEDGLEWEASVSGLRKLYYFTGGKHKYHKRSIDALLDATKWVAIAVNAQETLHMLLSHG
jgi:hypothetical protein